MEAFLSLCVFCCAMPGVRANLPVADSAAPPEARAAAALLTPFMHSQQATLVLMGQTRWTGAFLRELSADIPRMLSPSIVTLYQQHMVSTRIVHVLAATRCVHFVAAEGLDDLLSTMRMHDNTKLTRAIFWASVASPSTRDEVLRDLSRARVWLGGHQYALALTAPDGSTGLYNLTCRSDAACRNRVVTVLEQDTWSAAEQRWHRAPAVFSEFCVSRPERTCRVLTVLMLRSHGRTASKSLLELTKSVVHIVRQAQQRQRLGSQKTVRLQETSEYSHIDAALKECTLDAVLSDVPLFTLSESALQTSELPDMEMARVAVIVPAGFGAGVSLLDAVLDEFSAALWWATGVATLCAVLVLSASARRRDVSGAVLQVLAPMLGQAPPPLPPAPPRPMLAAWLLACVVLTAAYQGLLLGKLFSAVPRRELDSLRDVEDSGLPLKALANLARANILAVNLTTRIEYVTYSELQTVIEAVATARNCALITYLDRHAQSYMLPYMMPPKKLHLIQLPYSDFNIIGLTTKGQLDRLMSRALMQVEAAGLLARWRYAEYERERHHFARKLVLQQGPRTLTLYHLGPAFVVLGAGQAAGLAAFALEALCAWLGRREVPG
ncbi:Ionotropic receptor 172 [Frankliniella occidentalis]|nr:Ionotropic receptor 172 [Frankliniella occidentalis]